jgi:hypothetical protein
MRDDVEDLLERAGRVRVPPVDADEIWVAGRRRRAVTRTVRGVAVSVVVLGLAAPLGFAVQDRLTGSVPAVDIARAPEDAGAGPVACVSSEELASAPVATRAQAAVAFAAVLEDHGFALPADPPPRFTDADPALGQTLDQLAAAGIVEGTRRNTDHYAPADPLTRGQLASLAVRAYEAVSGEVLPGGDLPSAPDPHAGDLDRAWRAGLALGAEKAADDTTAPATTSELDVVLARLSLRLAGDPEPDCRVDDAS